MAIKEKLHSPDAGTQPASVDAHAPQGGLLAQISGESRDGMRPPNVNQIPGGAFLAATFPNSDFTRAAVEIPREYRACRVRIPSTGSSMEMRTVNSMVLKNGGAVIALPFSEEDILEAVAIFPNQNQANMFANGTRERSPRAEVFVQEGSSKGQYGGLMKGLACFPGNSFGELYADSNRTQWATNPDLEHVDIFERGQEVTSDYDNDCQPIPETFSRAGAMCEIKFGDMLSGSDAPAVQKVFKLIDRETDVYTLVGNRLTIASTQERAREMWTIRLLAILKEHPEAQMEFDVAGGKFEVTNVGTGEWTIRTLKSEAVGELRGLNVPGYLTRGAFTSVAQLRNFMRSPRGLKIRAEDIKIVGRGTVQLMNVEDRVTEVYTGGPREMIGRDKEWAQVLADANEVLRKGRTKYDVVAGDPGIGKTRLLSQLLSYFGQEENAHVVIAKANEYEHSQPLTYARRFVGALLSEIPMADSEEYQLLTHFAEGTTSEEHGEMLSVLQSNPARLAAIVKKVTVGGGIAAFAKRMIGQGGQQKFAFGLDDLQWCDVKSASMVAEILRAFAGNNRTLFVLSSRSDYQTMPRAIRGALVELGMMTELQLKALGFQDEEGAPTDLIRKYVLGSLTPPPNTDATLPTLLLKKLGDISEGNPFVVTQILEALILDELIYVDEKGNVVVNMDGIKFDDLRVESLFENRINRMTPGEKRALRVACLFGWEMTSELFQIVCPELLGDAQKLEELGLISMSPAIQMTQDRLRTAAETFFGKGGSTELGWELYVKLNSLEGRPGLNRIASNRALFALLRPSLKPGAGVSLNFSVMQKRYKAATRRGLSAIEELRKLGRNADASAIAAQLKNLRGYMDNDQQFELCEHSAHLDFELGRTENVLASVEAAQAAKASLDERNGTSDWAKSLELAILKCDAMHLLRASGDSYKGAIEELQALLLGVVAEKRKQGVSIDASLLMSDDGVDMIRLKDKLDIELVDLIRLQEARCQIMLNQVVEAHNSRNGSQAIHLAAHLIMKIGCIKDSLVDLSRISEFMFQMDRLPIGLERLLVEAKRLHSTITCTVEQQRRGQFDEDAIFAGQQMPERLGESLSPVLERALAQLREVSAAYQGERPVMAGTKSLLSTLDVIGKLELFSRQDRSAAESFIREAIRIAANCEDGGSLGTLYQTLGDIILNRESADTQTRKADMREAIKCYRQGMTEIGSLGAEEKDQDTYTFNACNAANAMVLLLETRVSDFQKRKSLIEEAWGYAAVAVKGLGPKEEDSPRAYQAKMRLLAQYIFPAMGKLRVLAQDSQIQLEVPADMDLQEAHYQLVHGVLDGAIESVTRSQVPVDQSVLEVLARKRDWTREAKQTLVA